MVKGVVVLVFAVLLFFLVSYVEGGHAPSNNAPKLVRAFDEIIMKEGVSLTINLSTYYEDIDGDNLTYTLVESENIVIKIKDEEMTLTPDDGYSGLTFIKIRVNDSAVTKTKKVLVLVKGSGTTGGSSTNTGTNATANQSGGDNSTKGGKNSPPTVSLNQNGTVFGPLGENITLSVTATDVDGDKLRYIWSLDGARVSGNESQRKFVDLETGEHIISIEINDGSSIVVESWKVIIEDGRRGWVFYGVIFLVVLLVGGVYILWRSMG